MHTVDVKTAAMLMGVGERQIQKLIKTNRIIANATKGNAGQGGISYIINVEDLPHAAQKRFSALLDEKDNSGFDRGGYINKKGKEKEAELMERLDLIRECLALMASKPQGLTAKVNALAEKNGISGSTLRTWVKKYESGGVSEVASMNRSDKGSARSICKLAQKMIADRVCQKNQPTNRAIYNELIKTANALGADACANCPYKKGTMRRAELMAKGLIDAKDECTAPMQAGLMVPVHYCTVDRYIKGMNESLVAYGRLGNKYWEAKYMPKIRREKPERVNEVWFGDHHQFDIFVLDDAGRAVRPWLTAWMDARSNCFVGTVISLNPNTDTIVRALDSGISYKNGSDFYGLPNIIYIDNGKDYRSKRMEGAGGVGRDEESIGRLNLSLQEDNGMLKTLGIGVIHALPYRGWSKTIERAFGTLERCFLQGKVPGWCGNSTTARPETLNEDIKKGALLTYEQFVRLFYTEIMPAYHAARGNQAQSPLEIYRASEKARGGGVPDRALMASFKLIKEQRRITPEGIRLKGEMYMDDRLIAHIGETVMIAYNKEDDETISVYIKGKYLLEAERKIRFKLVGESEENVAVHMARQKNARKAIKRILSDNREIASIVNGIASETIDINKAATLNSLAHINEENKRAEEKERIEDDRKWRVAQKAIKSKKVQDYFTRLGEELLSNIG